MSTTAPSTTITDGSTSTSSPSSTSSHTNSDTATLYLFTFLATILILVLLSASLVLRSYILRRRYRQRFQQALADGLFADLDNDTGQFDTLGPFRRSTRCLGPKPVMFDTWIQPADKDDTWSTFTPLAAQCSPSLSPPSSSLISSPQPSPSPSPLPGSPSSLQPRSSFLSHLRIPSPFSLSPRPFSPPPRQGQSPILSSTLSSIRSPPLATPASPDPSTHPDEEAAMLAVCVLVAMPDPSWPVHRPASDGKGKRVDPLDPPRQQGGDADPLLPSCLCRSGARTFHEDEGLPLLEFGVGEASMGDSVWGT